MASYYQQDLKKGRIKYICKFECYSGFEMSLSDFKTILIKNGGTSCVYCKEQTYLDNRVKFGSRQLTLDRIYNYLPHTESNSLIACWRCNKTRSNKYSVEEFQKIINTTSTKADYQFRRAG